MMTGRVTQVPGIFAHFVILRDLLPRDTPAPYLS